MLKVMHDNIRVVVSVCGYNKDGDEEQVNRSISLEQAVHLMAELGEAIDCCKEVRLVDRMREMMRLEKRN